jgi:general secretion pathway protein K
VRRDRQRGAALLTVLLLTATLAVLAVSMTEVATRSLSRTGAIEARLQGFWALRGLETAALSTLRQNAELLDDPAGRFFREPVVLPFEGATATLRFRDASNCFNLNDLVDSGEEGLVSDEGAIERFARLFRELGGNESAGSQAAARIADFIDSDTSPGPGSVEDFDYRRREVPYRTAGTYLASVSEIRAVAGFSPDVYRFVAPYLCTLPSDGAQVLNVNTLMPEDAPLLAGLSGGALTPEAAKRLIQTRPEDGYAEVGTFLANPLLAGADLPAEFPSMVAVGPTLLEMEITLESGLGRLRSEALVQRQRSILTVLERGVGERLP